MIGYLANYIRKIVREESAAIKKKELDLTTETDFLFKETISYKDLRSKEGHTQKEMADLLKFSLYHYRKLEKSDFMMSQNVAIKVRENLIKVREKLKKGE